MVFPGSAQGSAVGRVKPGFSSRPGADLSSTHRCSPGIFCLEKLIICSCNVAKRDIDTVSPREDVLFCTKFVIGFK